MISCIPVQNQIKKIMNSQLTVSINYTDKFNSELVAMFNSKTITSEDFQSQLASSVKKFVSAQDSESRYQFRFIETERADILSYHILSLEPNLLADTVLCLADAETFQKVVLEFISKCCQHFEQDPSSSMPAFFGFVPLVEPPIFSNFQPDDVLDVMRANNFIPKFIKAVKEKIDQCRTRINLE